MTNREAMWMATLPELWYAPHKNGRISPDGGVSTTVASRDKIFSPLRATPSSCIKVTSSPLKPIGTDNMQIIMIVLDKYTQWVYYCVEVILWIFVK